MWTIDRIRRDLIAIVADVLALETDEVQLDDSFFELADGESIEFLELSFQCERHFGVRMDVQKLFPRSEMEVDDDNLLTPETINNLKKRLPFLDTAEFEKNPQLDHVQQLLTIRVIAEYLNVELRKTDGECSPLPA